MQKALSCCFIYYHPAELAGHSRGLVSHLVSHRFLRAQALVQTNWCLFSPSLACPGGHFSCVVAAMSCCSLQHLVSCKQPELLWLCLIIFIRLLLVAATAWPAFSTSSEDRWACSRLLWWHSRPCCFKHHGVDIKPARPGLHISLHITVPVIG